MPDSIEQTCQIPPRPAQCPACGYYCAPQEVYCPKCNTRVIMSDKFMTAELPRRPRTVFGEHDRLNPHDNVILQFVPSAVCQRLLLAKPVVLGRGTSPDSEEFLDLDGFGAAQHGVSRHHCMLKRRDNFLVAVDLDSTNGTYLNDRPLLAQQEHIVTHGDRLILGRLHINVLFEREPLP